MTKLDAAAAEYRLLAEQVGFGLVLERGFDDPRPAAADAGRIGKGNILGVAGRILMNGDQAGYTATLDEFVTHQVPRPLGSGHEDIDVSGGNDLGVVDVEPVGEHQVGPLFQFRSDFRPVDDALQLIGKENHDDIGLAGSGPCVEDLESGFFGLGGILAPHELANDDVQTALLQVVGVGVTLAAITDDGDLLLLEQAQVAIFVIINFHHFLLVAFCT